MQNSFKFSHVNKAGLFAKYRMISTLKMGVGFKKIKAFSRRKIPKELFIEEDTHLLIEEQTQF